MGPLFSNTQGSRDISLAGDLGRTAEHGSGPTILFLSGSQQAQASTSWAWSGCLAYHSRGELQQLPLGLLHTLWISLNPDQVTLLAVRRDAHRHLVLVFDSVDLGQKKIQTHLQHKRYGGLLMTNNQGDKDQASIC